MTRTTIDGGLLEAVFSSHLILLGLAFVLVGCSETAAPIINKDGSTTTPVKLALNWYPEVEHGGFIAAETLGLYDAEKLDIELVPAK